MTINISLPEEVLKFIDEEKAKMNVSRSSFIVYCVKRVIEADRIISSMPELITSVNRMTDELHDLNKANRVKSDIKGKVSK